MDFLPLFMDVRGQAVLVVGGGAVAERKIRLLLLAGARVRIVAERLNEALTAQAEADKIDWLGKAWNEGHLEGNRLVYAASNDIELNRAVFAAAEARCLPVNVVDDREHCRFITPAVVDRSPLQVAISTGGASPVLARRVRAWMERLLPPGLGKVAAAAARLRAAAFSLSLTERRHFWDHALSRSALARWSELPQRRIEAEMRQALRARHLADRRQPGKVFLVGAGPGRPDLLTLRAHQLLGQADVILHDRLVPTGILDLARRDADFIDVGKRAGNQQTTQQRIHELLVNLAGQGKLVVRLKGGDPFVFGRGGEELEHLRANGVDYEVVPGVTAASACAAYAGIPLTHRDHAQALTLIAGHVQDDGHEPAWSELAGEGRTLAVYMGVKQAGKLHRDLLAAGLPRDLPVAVVADGTRDSQLVLHGTIDDLPALARRVRAGAPGLIIIGTVAALGPRLAWFESVQKVIAAKAA